MSLSVPHLSDEAVAAFADGVLSGGARERAARHTADCAECAYAVAVQREAVWALRSAPAPALPSGLLDRLAALPATTPLRHDPVQLAPDGSAVFPAFAAADRPQPRRMFGPVSMRGRRRAQQVAALTAGTAMLAMGVAASDSGPTLTGSGTIPARSVPAPAPPRPIVYDVPEPGSSASPSSSPGETR